jgi:CubicO group peptidase (beta-lactamase class C family)
MAQGKTQNISKKLANITTEPNVSSLIERSGVPGVSIAVIEDFAIDRLEVYGVENTTTQTPVSTQTLFQAASISKSLTAMIALRFVLEDRIALDEDIN